MRTRVPPAPRRGSAPLPGSVGIGHSARQDGSEQAANGNSYYERLITAVLILPAMLPPDTNGATIAARVTSPTTQPKKTRGRGVVTDKRCASPVAASASTKAVTLISRAQASR